MNGHLDGNVLAGPLTEVFAFDPTTALVCCASCGDVSALACAMVYDNPMGLVVRCHRCDNVLMVVVERPDRACLTARGMSWLQVMR